MTTMLKTADQDRKWLFQIGGVSGIALGVGYIAIIAMYVPIGAPPKGVVERLAYLSAHTTAWWWILGLSVVTDLLFLPLALSLYEGLKDVSRSMMLLATAFVALFVFLDLAITWTNWAALITLSNKYTVAVNSAEKSAIVAMAQYPVMVLQSGLLFVYNSLTLAIGLFLIGIVMLKSGFGKASAYLGIATGALGIIAVVGSFFVRFLDSLIILVSLLMMIWAMVVGRRLHVMGRD